jgi:L-fuconolactonase
MRIDAHQHFWRYDPVEYDWIDDSMRSIRRDFLPADLEEETRAVGISGVISVQARQTLQETQWLLELAEAHQFIRGVVGWVPLLEPDVAQQLERLTAHSKLRGVRHVVQAEPDERFMLRYDFNRGISRLKDFGLVYDILIFQQMLPAAIEMVDLHPDQIFVLDHLAKPRIGENEIEPWHTHLLDLAERPNVYCKVSGMVTEASYDRWTPEQLRPYWDAVLEAFGPERMMFGSDWPVCLVACAYPRWRKLVDEFAGGLSHSERAHLFGMTAVEAYSLET